MKLIFGWVPWLMVAAMIAESSAADATARPEITRFSPAQGIAGTAVTIEGAGLTSATAVQFGGVEAAFSILADLLTAIVPPNAKTGPITVVTANGTVASAENFTVLTQEAPSIASFSPMEGEFGTSVQIQGNHLSNVTSVKFNGVETSFSLVTGSLVATVPASASTGLISVTTAGGTAVSSAPFAVLQRGAPVVTGFNPASGPPGWAVEIQGVNLVNVTAVQFNGVNASFLSAGGTLRASVPSNATSGPITVVTASGTAASAQSFTVTLGPPPTISDFSPQTGEVGTEVEIRGTFLRDVLSVKFNGVDAAFTNSLFRPLTATVPPNAATGPITVVTRAGTATSASVFTVVNLKAPVITRFSPESGRAGELIQVYGTNLTGVVLVEFNGTKAEFIEFNHERFFAFVPSAASSGPIRVTTRFGVAISDSSFTVVGSVPVPEPPSLEIHAMSPTRIELSWTVSTGFQLETAESLTPPIAWTFSALTPVTNQGRSVVVVDLDGKTRFYRLNRRN